MARNPDVGSLILRPARRRSVVDKIPIAARRSRDCGDDMPPGAKRLPTTMSKPPWSRCSSNVPI
jgi:hypothetical protein